MMTWIDFILQAASLAIFYYGMRSIWETGMQRVKMIEIAHSLEELEVFDQVSFDAHLWRVLTFRNPYALYGELGHALKSEMEKIG